MSRYMYVKGENSVDLRQARRADSIQERWKLCRFVKGENWADSKQLRNVHIWDRWELSRLEKRENWADLKQARQLSRPETSNNRANLRQTCENWSDLRPKRDQQICDRWEMSTLRQVRTEQIRSETGENCADLRQVRTAPRVLREASGLLIPVSDG